MAAEAIRRDAAQVIRVIHPRRGQNWGPGREPGPVREEADKVLAAEVRAANECHAWISQAMKDPGAEREAAAGS